MTELIDSRRVILCLVSLFSVAAISVNNIVTVQRVILDLLSRAQSNVYHLRVECNSSG